MSSNMEKKWKDIEKIRVRILLNESQSAHSGVHFEENSSVSTSVWAPLEHLIVGEVGNLNLRYNIFVCNCTQFEEMGNTFEGQWD